MPVSGYILSIVAAYLLGSIPTGFLVAKGRGIDIRNLGSGNIGATNVFRILGVPAGIFVLLVDALKGWLAVAVALPLIAWMLGVTTEPVARADALEWPGVLAGFSAVLGHNFTCWLHFKGGKGIATSAGVLVALVPVAFLPSLALWGVVLLLTRYMSLASIVGAASLPLATWIAGYSLLLICVTGAMAVLAIYKHKSNIKRLLNGTESRIGGKSDLSKPATTEPRP